MTSRSHFSRLVSRRSGSASDQSVETSFAGGPAGPWPRAAVDFRVHIESGTHHGEPNPRRCAPGRRRNSATDSSSPDGW